MASRLPRNDFDALSHRIKELEAQIRTLSSRPLVIPILNSDPGTSYPGNIFAYPDGKLNVRLKDGTLKQYTPVAPAAPTTTNPTPPTQPKSQSATYTAQWGQAYRSTGAFTGANNAMLYQGNSGSDSFNLRQRSLIGFDYAAIAAALAGATITKVEIWLAVQHTWYHAGGTFWLGLHNNSVKPSTWGGTIGRDFVSSIKVPETGSKWYNISTEFGAKIRDSAAKGLTLQAPNDDRAYYGYASGGPGTSTDLMPKLRISYVK